jgi:hypothetical protein
MIEPTNEEYDLANDLIKRDLGFEYHVQRLPRPPLWPFVLVLFFHLKTLFRYWPAAVEVKPKSKKVQYYNHALTLWQYAVNLKIENMRLMGKRLG